MNNVERGRAIIGYILRHNLNVRGDISVEHLVALGAIGLNETEEILTAYEMSECCKRIAMMASRRPLQIGQWVFERYNRSRDRMRLNNSQQVWRYDFPELGFEIVLAERIDGNGCWFREWQWVNEPDDALKTLLVLSLPETVRDILSK